MAVEAGNLEDAVQAAAAHKEASQRLVVARAARSGHRKRRSRYRVKSYKLAVSLNSNLVAIGVGGIQSLQVPGDQLESGEGADSWVRASIVSDKGPDCMCLMGLRAQRDAVEHRLDSGPFAWRAPQLGACDGEGRLARA